MSETASSPPISKINLTPEADPTTWQGKALMFLLHSGRMPTDIRDEMTAIILAILKNNRNHYPRYAYQCYVDAKGEMYADFAPSPHRDTWIKRKHVGSTITVRDTMRALADGLDLSDAERMDMFQTLRRWIFRDDRDQPNPDTIPGYVKPNPDGSVPT